MKTHKTTVRTTLQLTFKDRIKIFLGKKIFVFCELEQNKRSELLKSSAKYFIGQPKDLANGK